MLKIINAFNGQPIPSSSSSRNKPPIKKKRRLNVIHDDEEEDESMEEISGVGNSFGYEFSNNNNNNNLAGGFEPHAGGFEPEAGGGFMVDDDEDVPMAGGFEIEPEENGGGFIQDDQDQDQEESYQEVPAVATRTRIPFRSIPTALEALSFPANAQVMDLFKEAASDDEDGVSSVSKDRFVKICAVLTGDSDDDEDDDHNKDGEEDKEDSDSSDGEEEEYVEEDVKLSSRKGTSRRITRSNAEPLVEKVLESEDDQVEESDSDIEIIEPIILASSKKGKGSTSNGKSTNSRKKKSVRVVSAAEALDSFELFFEGSDQGGKVSKRTIGYEEILNAAKLLDEDLKEEDVSKIFLGFFHTLLIWLYDVDSCYARFRPWWSCKFRCFLEDFSRGSLVNFVFALVSFICFCIFTKFVASFILFGIVCDSKEISKSEKIERYRMRFQKERKKVREKEQDKRVISCRRPTKKKERRFNK